MTIKFPGGTKSVISTKGVHLYLDTKGEHDIGGEDYVGFTTIFRNDEVTAAYNEYQLSNGGSVRTPPEPAIEPESAPEPTPEEPTQEKPALNNPTLEKPMLEKPTLENPMQLNKDIQKTDLPKKEKSNTDLSSTDSIPIHSLNPLPYDGEAAEPPERKRKEATDAYSVYEEIIKDNIEYDHFVRYGQVDKDRLDEIVSIILETVCSKRKTIRIAGDDYPAELVKAKFMKLNSSHIEFVFDCMKENTTKIRNIKQYLKAVLFNAPNTIDSYYTALVAHDMATGKI